MGAAETVACEEEETANAREAAVGNADQDRDIIKNFDFSAWNDSDTHDDYDVDENEASAKSAKTIF